ncbi:Ger(x)C family spore germination protein [Fictibacillus fluitans]|uniref:Ger(X)C family spore germination protein n=1 Tax=Fictibacillus fluitans TaxID=3058422 RepID=A0ABT8HSK8_9BACL|nr:Ger(x)C family spore germination protein [Fictibacillus sp. NE201]MDN4523734.1 Ger(x)C family spore germination protein [Fictibacillus sp. NE201]
MKITCIVLVLLLLAGCWDQRLLKNARLIYSVAIDLKDDGKLFSSVTIRSVQESGGGQGGSVPVNDYLSATGNTPRQMRQNMDSKLSGEFEASKNRMILLGEKLSYQDIYPILDIFYRDPKSSLGASVAIVDGKADEITRMKQKDEVLIGEYVFTLLKSGERDTYIPKQNVQTICPILFDPGRDLALPYIYKSHSEIPTVGIKGLALMENHQYSGVYLNKTESSLMLLMSNQKGKIARFTKKVKPSEKNRISQYITIDVLDEKAKLQIQKTASGKIRVHVPLQLKVEAIEYPIDHLIDKKTVLALNKKLSGILTKDANRTLNKMQKANSDTLGIGRELMAYHPDLWNKTDWEKDYPEIDLSAKVTVNIVDHGIIN